MKRKIQGKDLLIHAYEYICTIFTSNHKMAKTLSLIQKFNTISIFIYFFGQYPVQFTLLVAEFFMKRNYDY